MTILTQSAIAAHQAKLVQPQEGQRYSQYPVHEMEFWNNLFAFAKNPNTAQQVLNEIGDIENEPCIENDRVFRNVQHARNLAKIALLN
ncbi:hypothetical protein [Janthinobacterium sp. UMAB-56]|uniref:hypothetical protein n=1 Tax=Janthinobacterium sp. UMAB-56 TaxID=1365361 RepID=UPI001C57D9EB|nr:hypothetical protein [Janthinobacterium sp. UMAB-56]